MNKSFFENSDIIENNEFLECEAFILSKYLNKKKSSNILFYNNNEKINDNNIKKGNIENIDYNYCDYCAKNYNKCKTLQCQKKSYNNTQQSKFNDFEKFSLNKIKINGNSNDPQINEFKKNINENFNFNNEINLDFSKDKNNYLGLLTDYKNKKNG